MTIRLSKLEHLRPFRIQFWTLQTMPWEFDKCCQVGLSLLPPSHKDDYDPGFEYDKIWPSPRSHSDLDICAGCCHVIIIESARATCPGPALGYIRHVSLPDILSLHLKSHRVTAEFNFHPNNLKPPTAAGKYCQLSRVSQEGIKFLFQGLWLQHSNVVAWKIREKSLETLRHYMYISWLHNCCQWEIWGVKVAGSGLDSASPITWSPHPSPFTQSLSVC